eukprot:5299623-Amphidinium_carterae.2
MSVERPLEPDLLPGTWVAPEKCSRKQHELRRGATSAPMQHAAHCAPNVDWLAWTFAARLCDS